MPTYVRNQGPTRAIPPLGLLLICLTLMAPLRLQAACTWAWDCTNGQCRQLPLCDYSSEIPPLRPLETPPSASPALRPMPPHVFPPPGKKACREAYLCNSNGECRWKSVCE
jgi:hypothetical protein